MKKSMFLGIVYAFVHFSVEVCCFYFLFSRMNSEPIWFLLTLLYDAVAFLPQNIIGIISDKYPRLNVGVLGSLLVVVALFIRVDLLALILIGLGNACVHVSGAQYTLRGTEGKITPAAIFVGAGSFGVITGQLLGVVEKNYIVLIPVAVMLLSGWMMWLISRKINLDDFHAQFDIASEIGISGISFLAFIAVAVRGYIAYAIPTEWNKTVVQTVILFCFMGIGKILGGILADRIGFRKVTYISLLGGLPFLLFGNSVMIVSLVGVALFSMTMPITIAILASVFPKRPGFAFGITTMGLFAGTLPAFLIRPQTLAFHQTVVIALTAIALPAIILCIKKGE